MSRHERRKEPSSKPKSTTPNARTRQRVMDSRVRDERQVLKEMQPKIDESIRKFVESPKGRRTIQTYERRRMKALTMGSKVLTDLAEMGTLSRNLAKQSDAITGVKEVLFGADDRGAVVAVVLKSGRLVELRPQSNVVGLSF